MCVWERWGVGVDEDHQGLTDAEMHRDGDACSLHGLIMSLVLGGRNTGCLVANTAQMNCESTT